MVPAQWVLFNFSPERLIICSSNWGKTINWFLWSSEMNYYCIYGTSIYFAQLFSIGIWPALMANVWHPVLGTGGSDTQHHLSKWEEAITEQGWTTLLHPQVPTPREACRSPPAHQLYTAGSGWPACALHTAGSRGQAGTGSYQILGILTATISPLQ